VIPSAAPPRHAIKHGPLAMPIGLEGADAKPDMAHRTNPLARESAARGAEQAARDGANRLIDRR
jgi:hypothetical protein